MNVPKLRFKADDGSEFPEWEEKKLGNLFPYIRNGFVGVVTDYFCSRDEGVEYIEGTNIHDGHIDDVIDLYVTHEFDERHINSRLKKDDIVMVQSGHVGECAVVGSHHENANCHALIVMSNGGHVVSEFYVAYFYSGSGKNVISFIQTGNTVKHILASEMKKIIVPYPSLPEQQKIASFLSTIDEIIQSTESELTAWQERKKGVMQKIFNREVRFKADDGSEFPEWEEKRLGELYQKNTERNGNQFTKERTISISTMKYNSEGNGADEKSLPSYKVLRVGDIAFEGHENREFAYGRFVLNDLGDGIMSPRFSCLRPIQPMINGFWKYYIHYEPIMRQILVRATKKGTMMHELVYDDFYKQTIKVPSLPEQQKIADCLSSLDDVINQIQAELSAWKEFKKGLLQQMFV